MTPVTMPQITAPIQAKVPIKSGKKNKTAITRIN